MPAPILATKLYVPQSRPGIVPRPRLMERLNEGLAAGRMPGLALISASAGFGKTTLISEWIGSPWRQRPSGQVCNRPVAWLSLDEGDNDPTRFLTYLIAALQTLPPKIGGANIGAGALAMLHASQPPPTESILTTLVNEISTLSDSFILVLDDYHVIESQAVDQALTFLVEHQPRQMHLVIATREDPHIPLARLRARGQLTELRAADLRFSPAEAAEFLNQVMGLNLNDADIAALETRTEGWVAGLQLAALSMQNRQDTASFIQSFTGSHRFVLDYLVEEVLQRQPERVRSFLLQTSILDRFCASLCNAVTEREDGKAILETLERGNLFVIPLDDRRQWVRYHHLFAEVLRAHLMEEQPDLVSALHRRASEWYEQNDLRPDAIRHVLASRDFERAADLIELARPAMDLNFQSALWLGWAKALPDELVRARPVLSYSYASALLDIGEIEAAEARLRDAERWLEPPSIATCPATLAPHAGAGEPACFSGEQSQRMIVVDEERFRSLPASIAASRAYQAQALGDIPGSVKYAELSLKLNPEEDSINRIQATALLGLTYWASGDLNAANQAFADLTKNMLTTGNITVATGTSFVLANIRVALGRLHEAGSAYEQALQLALQSEPMPVGTADLYRGMSELYCERGDLEAATQTLLRSKELGEQAASTDWLHRLCVAQARLKEVQGDLDGALTLLDEAERMYVRDPLPDVQPVAALKARIWVAQGKMNEALSWARERGLSIDDNLSYLKEFEHTTLARILIARTKQDRADASIHEALRLLKRLLQAAEEGERTGSVIEILLLQALAFQAQGNLPHALAVLERALALAEPQGYVRIFVDEGEAMRLLLEKQSLNRGHPLTTYADKLLAAFPQSEAAPKSTRPGQARAFIHQKPDIIEPLSERELEVLKLLRGELSGPEIAQHLSVSINTLRTHTKNIFSKLGVNDRRAAIRRAEELDLF